jgi:hypothetical protein
MKWCTDRCQYRSASYSLRGEQKRVVFRRGGSGNRRFRPGFAGREPVMRPTGRDFRSPRVAGEIHAERLHRRVADAVHGGGRRRTGLRRPGRRSRGGSVRRAGGRRRSRRGSRRGRHHRPTAAALAEDTSRPDVRAGARRRQALTAVSTRASCRPLTCIPPP